MEKTLMEQVEQQLIESVDFEVDEIRRKITYGIQSLVNEELKKALPDHCWDNQKLGIEIRELVLNSNQLKELLEYAKERIIYDAKKRIVMNALPAKE